MFFRDCSDDWNYLWCFTHVWVYLASETKQFLKGREELIVIRHQLNTSTILDASAGFVSFYSHSNFVRLIIFPIL